jgi:adenylate cyclase
MAIVPGFEYDVFISYRHNDNLDGWVTDFVQNLEKEIRSTLKDPLTIYFDKNPHDGLLETDHVDKSLEGKLKCLIFIPIVSQTYCDQKSFAWQHEFCAFNKISKGDPFGREVKLNSGNVGSRLMPIKIHDLDADDKIAFENESGGILRAIEFIYKEPGVNRPLTIDDNEAKNLNKTRYKNQLNKVANAIKEIIVALKNPDIRASQVTGNDRPTVDEPRRNKRMLIGSILLLLIATAGYFLYQQQVIEGKQAVQSDKSIAVLPFVDMSPGKDQEYLGDGIAEEIITALSRIRELKVIGRTSSFQFKGEKVDLRDVGEKLDVSTVLEGSIMKSGDKVRITAQLINVSDGAHIWSERYDKDMDDIFIIQDQISKAISDKMKISLLGIGQSNKERHTTSTEAYENYLRGQQIIGPSKGRAARPFFEKAIQLDSNYADAYSGLALSYFFEWQRRRADRSELMLPLALKVRELDPTSEKSHELLYVIYYNLKWEWKFAEEEYQKYLAINPTPLVGHALNRADVQGDLKGGIEEMNRSLVADPINTTNLRLLARLYTEDHQSAKGKEAINKALQINPSSALAYRSLAHLNILEGEYQSALENIAKADALDPDLPTREFAIWALVKANRMKDAKEYYASTISSLRNQSEYLADKARIEFYIGNLDEGFRFMEESLSAKEFLLLTARHSPSWDIIRDHPRFKEFMKRVPVPPAD